MTAFQIEIPLPPSVNRLWQGHGKNKRRRPEYTQWINEAGWRINAAKAKGAFKALPDGAWYWTDVRFPLNHLGDSDNRLKALHDVLCEMQATPDDEWLLGGTYQRCASVPGGLCRVGAVSLGGDAAQASMKIQQIAAAVSGCVTIPLEGVIS